MTARASNRFFLLMSCLVYLAMLWFVSGISRTGSFTIFSAGVVALVACGLAFWAGRKRPLFVLYLGLLMLTATTGVLEAVLRLSPSVLQGALANHAYGGYHCLPGGIYDRDQHLGYALRPNQRGQIYWNGHWWRHATNAAGYRGPRVEHADAVFLGDSMIYGHGVENDETAASQFAAQTGCSTANLGQQGACLVQMVLRYSKVAGDWRPRAVFVCCHPNDIDEAAGWYPAVELERFVAAPLEAPHVPLAHPFYWPASRWRLDHQIWGAHLAPALRIGGALSGWRRGIRDWPSGPAIAATGAPMIPSPAMLEAAFAPLAAHFPAAQRLGWRVHLRALAQLKHDCARQGATLVVFDLGIPRAFSQAIEDEARRLGVNYSSAGRKALDEALAGEHVYLADDGHWTPEGNAIVARELAKWMRETSPRVTPSVDLP